MLSGTIRLAGSSGPSTSKRAITTSSASSMPSRPMSSEKLLLQRQHLVSSLARGGDEIVERRGLLDQSLAGSRVDVHVRRRPANGHAALAVRSGDLDHRSDTRVQRARVHARQEHRAVDHRDGPGLQVLELRNLEGRAGVARMHEWPRERLRSFRVGASEIVPGLVLDAVALDLARERGVAGRLGQLRLPVRQRLDAGLVELRGHGGNQFVRDHGLEPPSVAPGRLLVGRAMSTLWGPT